MKMQLQETNILSCINRSLIRKTQEVTVLLYSALGRPQLENWVQFWVPHVKKDVDKLESPEKGNKNDQRLRKPDL